MQNKERLLKYYLYLFGFISTFFITTVPIIWGDLFLWQPRNIPTEIMMGSIYFAMGIVMIANAKNPINNKSFTDFLILANTAHAFVMLVTAQHIRQIILDVLPVGLMGVLPLLVYPWGLKNFLWRSSANQVKHR